MNLSERVLISLGVAYILLGLILNEHVVARILIGETSLPPSDGRNVIRGLEAVLVLAGLAVIALRRHARGADLALALTSLLVFGPLAAELFLRAGIALGLESFRDPRLYASWTDDEDQWKLRYHWTEKGRIALDRGQIAHDPDLGWVSHAEGHPEPPSAPDPVLVYGDSFIYGTGLVPADERLPARLGDLFGDRPVVNYSVPGYGLDQIYLRFRATQTLYERPAAVIGLMTLDIDRSVLTVRPGPKPYFALDAGELVLHGVPVPSDRVRWHAEHPPSIRSYLFALAATSLRLRGFIHETETPYRQEQKKAVTDRLLAALAAEAKARDMPLCVVLFYPEWQIDYVGWREVYLKEALADLELPYVDTKELLARGEVDKGSFYLPPPDRHPTSAANERVAEEIAGCLTGGQARGPAPAAR